MLDKMREGSQSVAVKIILSVIILSFVLAGIGSYLGSGSADTALKVNDQEISQASVEHAYQNERARLQQQYGEQFDILAANPNFTQQLRAQATQQLISDVLIAQAVSEMGLRVGDEQVKNEIRNMAEFQVDGSFNNEQYLSLLRRATYTPAQFSMELKQDMQKRQLLQVLVGSEFVLPGEISAAGQLQAQKRIAKVLTVATADFEDAEQVSDADIRAYYEGNKQLFQDPEKVSVDYVLLDAATLADQISINQDDIETYYDYHKSDYQRPERRKVAHILVQGDTDAAQQKAAAILAELKKGADFAQLAAEKSDDSFSAKNNGELDWFEPGVMDPAFDDAAFSLTKEAPLSDLVKSQFGYHIIKLIAVEESKTLALADVQKQVEEALKQEKMNELYYELQNKLGEVAFESPDSLDEAAAVINSQVLHSELFSAEQAPEILSDRKVLQTLFDINFREEGMNSEPIELSENTAVVVRVNEYQAPTTQALSEVSDLIASQLQAERAHAAAQAFVESITAKLNAQESISSLLADKNIEFSSDLIFSRYSRDYDYQVVQKVFKLAKPGAEQLTHDWVATSTGDFAVIELSKVVDAAPADSDDEAKAQLHKILSRTAADATYQAFVAQLMENADIKYLVAK